MYDMVQKFPAQLREAMEIGKKAQIDPLDNPVHQIFVAGMGGSGIGADFVASFIRDECRVPYLVAKTYDAPAYVNEHTLAIASSYSGNTEETISCIQQVKEKYARIICIASGGNIIQWAKENHFNFIQLPNNWSSPRACLGYSIVAQMYTIAHLGLISNRFESELNQAIQTLEKESEEIQEKAKHLANALFEKTIIIYSTDRIEPVAIRFRQQINENAKRLCWHHVIPEMNHNELVGWRKKDTNLAVLFLRNSDDHPRNSTRMDLTKEIAAHHAGVVIELFGKGNSMIEKSLYLVHLLDFVSVFLADMNQVDAVEVKVIDFLKAELAKS